jgi:hypothetical protein
MRCKPNAFNYNAVIAASSEQQQDGMHNGPTNSSGAWKHSAEQATKDVNEQQ